MKRFTTYAQYRILQYYWNNHEPFSVFDLIEKKILHLPILGKLTIRYMESRGQILKYRRWNGEIQYISTTDSKAEWDNIWALKSKSGYLLSIQTLNVQGMNRYEKQEMIASLEKMIEAFRQSDDSDNVYCDIL